MKKEQSTKLKPLDQLLADQEKREPVSTRVKETTKSFFEKEAKRRKVSASALIAAILDDYAANYMNS